MSTASVLVWRRSLGTTVAAGLLLFFVLAPFYWILNIALTPEEQTFTQAIHYLPTSVTIQNFFGIFEAVAFGRAFLNSVVVSTSVTVLAIVVSIFAAYAFPRFNFHRRRLLIVSLLLIYILPGIPLLAPILVTFPPIALLNS